MAVDMSRFEGRRRAIGDEYAGKKVAADFGRFTSQQRFARDKSDYTRSFRRGQSGFMNNFAQRGMTGGGVRSGAFERALSNRVGDFQRNMGRMEVDQQQASQGFDLQNAQIDAWRNSALADLEMEKAREIAMAALNIQAIRPIIGGR